MLLNGKSCGKCKMQTTAVLNHKTGLITDLLRNQFGVREGLEIAQKGME